MARQNDDYTCVSETQIPFWACLFPEDRTSLKRVDTFQYAGRRVELEVYAMPDIDARLRVTSIEQRVPIQRASSDAIDEKSENNSNEGIFRLAYYEDCVARFGMHPSRWIHPALTFSRCFLKPKTSEHAMRAASRLQHLSGVKI